MFTKRSVKIETPALVLVFPYEGAPWGAITPHPDALEQVLDWVERAHPEHADMLRQFVAAVEEKHA